MDEVTRISPEEARKKVLSGEAILVCAYTADNDFARYHLAGAVPFSEFLEIASNMDKDREIIFYCN